MIRKKTMSHIYIYRILQIPFLPSWKQRVIHWFTGISKMLPEPWPCFQKRLSSVISPWYPHGDQRILGQNPDTLDTLRIPKIAVEWMVIQFPQSHGKFIGFDQSRPAPLAAASRFQWHQPQAPGKGRWRTLGVGLTAARNGGGDGVVICCNGFIQGHGFIW